MKVGVYALCDMSSGLGHLYRSIGLIKTLEKQGHKAFLSVTSAYGRNLAFGLTDKTVIVAPEHFWQIDADWYVVDCMTAPKPPEGRKCCFVGATGHSIDGQHLNMYDLVVCGGIPYKDKNVTDTWLTGFDYAQIWTGDWVIHQPVRQQIFLYTSIYPLDELVDKLAAKFSIVRPHGRRFTDDIAASQLCICPFGMTTLEAMFLGTPSIVFNKFQYAQRSVSYCANKKAIINIVESDNMVDDIVEQATILLNDDSERAWMSERGKKIVDGYGTIRLVNKLEDMV